ncbi:coproporphyrinogen III oxidase family protein [Candidatus Poribacteria bacterium]|jgi:oxygen-independent coproporphyrinogen III oxidase|nr:coproporphyrinogen III oxidase family protein [Candidatus Poribacteria bacterium]MBT7101144.1 coproporphyrinogen III oxidase family protein [Candidatus Poribacteria bacterium]MBT7804148.1 coproporphyrinogen III oxidase family protein [Candidatus Poribacteria bacterium]
MNQDLPLVAPEPATTRLDSSETEIGSVFVSNYPPYSFWSDDAVSAARDVLHTPYDPTSDRDLGLYLHIPFCRKRCKFCYFRVYTDKNADDISTYLDGLGREVELYAELPQTAGRPLDFVYFGGGTPSYIGTRHLRALVERVQAAMPWTGAREVAFECEPGTLTEAKVQTIRDIGVTRLSLGVENMDDAILAENGRAHVSKEIYRVVPWIQEADFAQVNMDLIAGMIGETWETWRETVKKTLELEPDSITVYQMELPFNTVYSRGIRDGEAMTVADWQTKRDWHAYAFEQIADAGYHQSSAYTMIRDGNEAGFVYRDAVWTGQDMIGAGVASFSHVGGTHFQNAPQWDDYLAPIRDGALPLFRAFEPTDRERLTRELILQMKTGRVEPRAFSAKFGVDVLVAFEDAFAKLESERMLVASPDAVTLTHDGLLRADSLLPEFYDAKYRNARYT